MLNLVNIILATLAVTAQILALVLIACFLFNNSFGRYLVGKILRYGKSLNFLVVLVATSGSLFYSEIAGFVPCKLCWLQRIFMYPLVLIIGLSLYKKDDKYLDYSFALALVGTIISLYHNYIYYQPEPSIFCSVANSCAMRYVLGYGYVTIPLMSLTAFLSVIILVLIKKHHAQSPIN